MLRKKFAWKLKFQSLRKKKSPKWRWICLREIESGKEHRGRVAVRFVIPLGGKKWRGAELVAINAEETGIDMFEGKTKIDNVAQVQDEIGRLQF